MPSRLMGIFRIVKRHNSEHVGVHRCTIVLRELEYVSSSCALCGSPDYEEANGIDLNPRTIIICDTCECEYHIGCLKNKGMADLQVRQTLRCRMLLVVH